jgi:peptidoglycan/xylan/chitin deacetylase (PgdA/CDA1 family)
MFHHFHGAGHPATQGSISAEQLADLIGFLGRERILPADEWLARAGRGQLGDGDLCLTFDDSLRCQYDIARPVLAELGLTAFWFVYTSVLEGRVERLELYRRFRTVGFASLEAFYTAFFEAVGRSGHGPQVERALHGFAPATYLAQYPFYITADRQFRYVRDEVLGPQQYHAVMEEMIASRGLDVQELTRNLWIDDDCVRQLHADGHVIGLHSHTHPTRMAELSPEAQEQEYHANFAHLERVLSVAPTAMSHPCDSYSEQTLDIVRRLGIVLGFRSNLSRPRTCELDYPREDHANLLAEMRV